MWGIVTPKTQLKTEQIETKEKKWVRKHLPSLTSVNPLQLGMVETNNKPTTPITKILNLEFHIIKLLPQNSTFTVFKMKTHKSIKLATKKQ